MLYEQKLQNCGKTLETPCHFLSALLNINMQSVCKPGAVQFHLVSIFCLSTFHSKIAKGMEMRAGLEVCLPTAYISEPVRPLVLLFASVYLGGKRFYLSIDSRSAESDFFNHRNERSSCKLCTL